MPFIRPPTLADKYGLTMTQVTAAGSILSTPALVHRIVVSLLNTAATGVAKLNDGTASGFAENAAGSLTLRLAAGDSTGAYSKPLVVPFNPPWRLDSGLFCSATGVSIAVLKEDNL